MRGFVTQSNRRDAAMNAVYATYFAAGRHPARTTVGVTGLALEALVEIDLIVRLGVD